MKQPLYKLDQIVVVEIDGQKDTQMGQIFGMRRFCGKITYFVKICTHATDMEVDEGNIYKDVKDWEKFKLDGMKERIKYLKHQQEKYYKRKNNEEN